MSRLSDEALNNVKVGSHVACGLIDTLNNQKVA